MTESNSEGNSEGNSENNQVGIPDEELPADLVPDDDNPLAEGLPDGETVDGLLTDGKRGDTDDKRGDTEDDEHADPSDADGATPGQIG